MCRRRCKFALACLPVIAAAGCACPEPCKPITLDVHGVAPAVDYRPLARVLARGVKPNGLAKADFFLAGHVDALDAQLRLLAVTGPSATPELFPTAEAALAYWYNARAAWAIKLLVAEGCPREIRRARLCDRRFPLDGRVMTLRQIDAILAEDGDFRTAVSSPGVTTLRARLPGKPFAAEGIREEVAVRFSAFLDDAMRFAIDIRQERILVPPVLWQFRQRLVEAHNAAYGTRGATLRTALLAYVTGSPHRRLQDAVGYRLVEAPAGTFACCVEEE